MTPITSRLPSSSGRTLRTPVLFGLGLAALATAAHGQTFFVDTFSSGFSGYNTPSGRSSFTHTSAAGVGGSSGAVTPSNISAAINSTTIGSFNSNGGAITTSVYFRTHGELTTDGTALNLASLGVGDSSTVLFATGTNFSVDVRHTGSGNNSLRLRQNDSGTGQVLSSSFSLAINTWYELSFTITHTSGTSYSLEASLFNWGGDGLTGGTQVNNASITTTFTSSIGTGTNLFAGFLARNDNDNTRNVALVDNFQVGVIPEPSSAAALAGLAVLGGAALRRRRR